MRLPPTSLPEFILNKNAWLNACISLSLVGLPLQFASAAPSLPAISQAADGTGLVLSWTGASAGMGIVREGPLEPGCEYRCYVNILWTNEAPSTFTDTSAEPGVEYRYKVYDHTGNNGYSPTVILQSTNDSPTTGEPAGDMLAGLRTDKDPVAIARVARPAPGQTIVDPAFRTRITRISNATPGQVVKPMYNTIQSFNADESLLMLFHTGRGEEAGHHLYDGNTYQHLRLLDILPMDIEQVYWSTLEANIFFYISKRSGDYGKFIRYNVDNDQKTVLHDFNGVCGGGDLPSGGSDPQMMSWDSDVIGLRCASSPRKAFTYRISTDSLSYTSLPTGDGAAYIPWYAPNPAASGKRVFMQGDVLNADSLARERSLDVTRSGNGQFKPEHAVMGRWGGNDAYFSVIYDAPPRGCDGDRNAGIGTLTAFDMQTGACRVIVGQTTGWDYPLSGVHPSSLSVARPELVAVSVIGYGKFDFFSNGAPAPRLTNELILADPRPGGLVYRLAHTRTTGKSAQRGDYAPYFGEPHPVISPSGTRILFGSDWYDSGTVDTYVVDLRP